MIMSSLTSSLLFNAGCVLFALSCIALSALLVACVYLYLLHRKYDHFPTPKGASFFFGHVAIFREEKNKNKKCVMEVIHEWTLQFDGQPFVIWFFYKPRIVIYRKEMIRDVFIEYNLCKPEMLKSTLSHLFGARFLMNGLLIETNHQEWKKKRHAANPAFFRSHLKTLIPDYNNSSELLLAKLNQSADSKTEVKMLDFFHRVTLDIIGKVAFDLDLDSIGDDQTPFPTAVSNCLKGLVFAFRNPFHKISPWTYGFQREIRNSIELLRETGRQCIARRKQAIERGETMPNDILSTMMKLLDHDSIKITDEDLLDDFLTFFIAGQETTANLLSFVVLEICQRQHIMDRLCDEISDVLGSRDYVEFDDLPKLQYMGQVLKETLRFYPPVPSVSRYTKDPIVLGNVQIPANSSIMVNIFSSHHSSAHFEDPDKFDPDRWSPENAEKIPRFAYFPFSAGPRNCIGQVFAQFEAKVVLARFLKTFKVKLCPGQTRAINQDGTISPEDGVMCTLFPR